MALLTALWLAVSARQALASCGYGTSLHARAEEGEAVPISKFAYAGVNGPTNWVSLDPENNAACAAGTRQSPINMVDGVFQMVSATDLKLDIADMAEGTEFENLGTTVEIVGKGGSLAIANMTYEFKQAHFHLPSEHLDNGTSIAMEMHMVFESADKEIAVIGVFIDLDNGGAPPVETAGAAAQPAEKRSSSSNSRFRGAKIQTQTPAAPKDGAFGGSQGFITLHIVKAPGISSPVLETIFSKVGEIAAPGTKTQTPPLAMTEIVSAVLTGSFQSYFGSLTTPPCKEGVRWLVATQKLQIQTATFEQVRSVIGFNARYPRNTPGQPNMLMLALGK